MNTRLDCMMIFMFILEGSSRCEVGNTLSNTMDGCKSGGEWLSGKYLSGT
jgi:hypothetical protein